MSDPTQTGQAEARAGHRRSAVLGRRRKFVVNRRYQLRAGVLAATVVLVLLVFINLLLYSTNLSGRADRPADVPQLAPVFEAQNRVELYLVGVASLVFLAGAFLLTVLETHRTSGAAYNLARRLEDIAQGRYVTSLRLRRGDNLVELEPAFNGMVRSLRERALADAETLARLADQAESVADCEASGHKLAVELRRLADDHRRRVG